MRCNPLFIIILVVLCLLVVPVSADWLTDWQYRKSHTINNTGSELTDYQMMYTINRSSGTDSGSTVYVGMKCNESYDDIRFTNATGGLLDYWIEESDSSDATIWVEVDTITASGDTTIYLYYGNAGASAYSNGDDTFDFFDDFPGSSLDTEKWDVLSGSPSIADSEAVISGDSIISDNQFGPGVAYRTKVKYNVVGGTSNYFIQNGFQGTGENARHTVAHSSSTYSNKWDSYDGSYELTSATGVTANTFCTFEVKWPSSASVTFAVDDTDMATHTSQVPDSPMQVRLRADSTGGTTTLTSEWILVRKYAATEPTVSSWCSEDENTMLAAAFTSDVTDGYPPFAVNFTDLSTNTPTSWYWDFGDGYTSTDQNATHWYNVTIGDTITTYNVSLNATNSDGSDWENKTAYITAYPLNASFVADSVVGNTETVFTFTDLTDNGTPTSWNWSFGDGYYSGYQNPTHTYMSAGTFNVSLTTSSGYSYDEETKLGYITVGYAPISNFTADDTIGAAPHTVVFTGDATGTLPINYYWDVDGDGSFDYFVQSPTHDYLIAGVYSVNLFVNSSYGSDWENKTGYITVGNALVAGFSGVPTVGAVPLTVTFTDSSTGDAPLSYAWDVDGDGSFDYYTQNPAHIYGSPGTYSVNLRVTNTYGVSWENKTNYITTGHIPSASFTGVPTTSELVPTTVTFTDTSINSPTNWAWDVDNDGSVDYTTQNCMHTYNALGKYTVNLTVSNAFGSTYAVYTDYILMGLPSVNFYADRRWSEHSPLSVEFVDISTNTPNGWEWQFGDGTTSSDQNPTHEYSRAGTYTVVLRASNPVGEVEERKVGYVSVGSLDPITPYDRVVVTPRPTTTYGAHATTLIESNYNVSTYSEVLPHAFTDIIDSEIAPQIFWGIVFAFVFIALFMRVGDVPLLVLFGLLVAGTILAFIPGEWQAIAQAFVVVGLAAIFYILIKGRFR